MPHLIGRTRGRRGGDSFRHPLSCLLGENRLLLNGKAIKLTGGSVHHDNRPLRAAAFDRAEERKVQLLKAAGHNAVRTVHNARTGHGVARMVKRYAVV
jgi:hypothetical protein